MSPARARSTQNNRADLGRRPDIEDELENKYHVSYAYVSGLATQHFDIEAGLRNQARFEAIDENTVEQYVEAVKRGDIFPAVIAYRPRKNGKLVIVDGNHRLVAHDRAGYNIDCYELSEGTRGQVVALMTYAFNTRHGRPTTEQERLRQAVYLVDGGASHEAAAAAVNVPVRALKRELAKEAANKRADEVGLNRREWDALAASSRARLLNITTDEGFLDAAHLAFAARLNAEEVFELVALINSTKSAAKQRALVKAEAGKYSDRMQAMGGGVLGTADRRAVGPKQRIAMALGQVTALPDDISAIGRLYQDAERDQAAQQLMDASQRLRKIALELNPKAQ